MEGVRLVSDERLRVTATATAIATGGATRAEPVGRAYAEEHWNELTDSEWRWWGSGRRGALNVVRVARAVEHARSSCRVRPGERERGDCDRRGTDEQMNTASVAVR